LYGGFVLARSQDPVDIISLKVPNNLFYVILHPHIDIDTSEARQILPKLIPLSGAVEQWANTAAVTTALFTEDFQLLKRSISDNIIEPIRAREIPDFKEMKDIALDSGSVGFGVSGSGPSVFALAESEIIAKDIERELVSFYEQKNKPFDIYLAKINTQGPKVLELS
jgi:homoserine kinase